MNRTALMSTLLGIAWLLSCSSTEPTDFGGDDDSQADDDDMADDDDDDVADDDDDVADDDDDDIAPGSFALTTGTYRITIDELHSDTCHASTGDGIHVHVGDEQLLELTVDGTTLTGQDEQVSWSGERDGDTFELLGTFSWDVGSQVGLDCVLAFETHMDSMLVADDEFTYDILNDVDGVGDDCHELEEDSGGAYPLVPSFPCAHEWSGTGLRLD